MLGYFGAWFPGRLRHFAGGEVLHSGDWVLWYYKCGMVPKPGGTFDKSACLT